MGDFDRSEKAKNEIYAEICSRYAESARFRESSGGAGAAALFGYPLFLAGMIFGMGWVVALAM